VAETFLEHLLRVFGVLRDTVFRRSRLGEIAQQRRHILDSLAGDLDLALGDGLDALDGELVCLAQRLDISALTGHQSLDVERPEAEIRHHLRDIEIEKGGTCFRHSCDSGVDSFG
jgi:hypothetical protein